jgi:hypothetical protein
MSKIFKPKSKALARNRLEDFAISCLLGFVFGISITLYLFY